MPTCIAAGPEVVFAEVDGYCSSLHGSVVLFPGKPLIYIWNGESGFVRGRKGSNLWKVIASCFAKDPYPKLSFPLNDLSQKCY